MFLQMPNVSVLREKERERERERETPGEGFYQ